MKKPGPPKREIPPLPPQEPPKSVIPEPANDRGPEPGVVDRNLSVLISVVIVAVIVFLGWWLLW